MRIHQLPPAVANQIAAGEVIERPASVVKELLENSLDAHASAISIEVGYGGLNQIKVSDNGVGIVAEDLPLALAAHATSKITKLDDLYAITSMGFRGEALASIASVAKVTLSSKTAEQEHAMMARAVGNNIQLTPCARTNGTTIDVVDIFYNAPVRKRFLKSEKMEFQSIEGVIKRFALSAPHIALSLKHNGKLILTLPSAANDQALITRMTKLFGSAFVKDAVFMDVERNGLRLHGWISGQNFQRSQNDKIWIYVNQRMVKDKLIYHALKQVYEGVLHPGRFPACLLYLTIPNAEVDVNVHPTKHEVRFQQPRLIHDFFTSQIRMALNVGAPENQDTGYENAWPSPVNPVKTTVCEPQTSFTGFQPKNEAAKLPDRVKNAPLSPVRYSPWVLLNQRHILVFIEQQPCIVDVISLQQQITHDQLTQSTLPLAHRPLLVPIRVQITEGLKEKRNELMQFLGQLGVQMEYSDDDNFLIRSIPIQIPWLNVRLFLDSLSSMEHFDLDTLRDLITQSQSFDPGLLSLEEQTHLNHHLATLQTRDLAKPLLYKTLTEDDCRIFLDE